MKEKEESNIISILDVINESAKPVMIPIAVAGNKCIPYIRPTDAESDSIKKEVDKEIQLVKERDKLSCYTIDGKLTPGKVPISDKEIETIRTELQSELTLWYGLNKADKTVTKEMIKQIPLDVKTQINLCLTKIGFGNLLTDSEVGGLKNLLALTRDL